LDIKRKYLRIGVSIGFEGLLRGITGATLAAINSHARQFRAQIHDFQIANIAENPVSFLCRVFPNNAQALQVAQTFIDGCRAFSMAWPAVTMSASAKKSSQASQSPVGRMLFSSS
jgi:hypothetical protein